MLFAFFVDRLMPHAVSRELFNARISIRYQDSGVFCDYVFFKHNQEYVIHYVIDIHTRF